MLNRLAARSLRRRIGRPAVPVEIQREVVVAVIRVAVPFARQPDDVRRFLEASIAYQLREEPALDVLEHELHELPVKKRADSAFDSTSVNRDACRGALGESNRE